MNSLPKTVTRQRRDCDLNPGRSAPESSTLTTQLSSHPVTELLLTTVFVSELWVCCALVWTVVKTSIVQFILRLGEDVMSLVDCYIAVHIVSVWKDFTMTCKLR